MVKHRYLNTKFWSDGYIQNLDPTEKLLFLYFITNQYTDICGVYEITLKQVALDTGVDWEMITKIIKRFEKDQKIYYFEGWIYVKNFAKHQSTSEDVKKGIERCFTSLPANILAKIKASDTPSPHPPQILPTQPDQPYSTLPYLTLPHREGRFAPPSLAEVSEYINHNGYNVDPEELVNFYESKGWLVGKAKMKNWQAAVRTWHKRNGGKSESDPLTLIRKHFTKWKTHREMVENKMFEGVDLWQVKTDLEFNEMRPEWQLPNKTVEVIANKDLMKKLCQKC